MVQTRDFWDKLADRYAAQPIKDQQSYEHTMERVRHYLRGDDDVLEVGCGTGTTALLLSGSVAHITATDISPNMVAIGRDKAAKQGTENVTFRAEPADWTEPGKVYDAVLGFNLLHLLKDPHETVRKLAASLKPGGLIITKTVCLKGNPIYPIMIGAMRLVGKAPYVGIHSTSDVDRMFRDAGLEILETGQFPKKPPSHFVVARKPG